MDGYINNITLVEDIISRKLKLSVTCPLCENILVEPMMCKCQNIYCKACIDNWSIKNKKCPNNCSEPNYQKCLIKNDILSKLKFRCLGCQKEIYYNDAESHHNSCCPDKKISKLKNVSFEEISNMKQSHFNNLRTIKGKKNKV